MTQAQLNAKLVAKLKIIYESVDDLKKIEEIIPDYSREKFYEKLAEGNNKEQRYEPSYKPM